MKLRISYLLFSIIPVAYAADAPNNKKNLRQLQGNSGNAPGQNGGGNPFNDGDQKTYIVTFKNKDESPSQRCAALSKSGGGSTKKVYQKVLNGCAMSLPPGAVAAMRNNPSVSLVEEDQMVYTSQTTPWGLDRIDQCELPLSNSSTKQDADGVKVYILDTGIQKDNVDFNGMIDEFDGCHTDASADNGSPFADGNGHGTHVASTTCGLAYGVASNCQLCAVKVLTSSGSGTTAGVIDGIDFVASNCGGDRCVGNMSLGGGFSSALNQAVANAVTAGVTMVVAAGNDNANACNYSPAAEPSAITVGSTTSSDSRSSFSNKGSCLDVFAPGSSITAAWIGANTATRTISGTSMASPHVAGIAAGILGGGALSPAEVLDAMLLQAKSDVISDDQSPGVPLATTVSCNVPPVPTISPAPTPSPPNLVVEILTDNYPAETRWTLTSECGGESTTGGPYNAQETIYKGGVSNASGRYTFTITDSANDGLCCGFGIGNYKVMMDGVQMAAGDSFTSTATHTFGSCGPVTPSPTKNPVTPSPTKNPVTPSPTKNPVTASPTKIPTRNPTAPPVPVSCGGLNGGTCKNTPGCTFRKGICS